MKRQPARTLKDPVISKARKLSLTNDFKTLADLIPRILKRGEKKQILADAFKIETESGELAKIKYILDRRYEQKAELLSAPAEITKPRYTLKPGSKHKNVFDYIEATWDRNVKLCPRTTKSTLIPLPNPILIPGARFQETYYWDSYFVVPALLKTGRESLVRGQIENFLFLIENYGLVPNGNRDYYLTRSQPPLLSRMVRKYLEHRWPLSSEDQTWLAARVLPLIKKDYYDFWMNPHTRYDSETGLNHHYDGLKKAKKRDRSDRPRPERSAYDCEEKLARSYRDVRAEAESGKDFTDAFEGEATQYAGLMLNSILFGLEQDLAWFSKIVGRLEDVADFSEAAEKRLRSIHKYLKDPDTSLFYDYHLVRKRRSPVLTADTFLPIYFNYVSESDALQISQRALTKLEAKGGLMSSDAFSGKQWDAPYGWAPQMMFVVEALIKHDGSRGDGLRLAKKWTTTIENVFDSTGKILEKYDVVRAAAPVEDLEKYVTQADFLWTKGVYVWLVTEIFSEPVLNLS